VVVTRGLLRANRPWRIPVGGIDNTAMVAAAASSCRSAAMASSFAGEIAAVTASSLTIAFRAVVPPWKTAFQVVVVSSWKTAYYAVVVVASWMIACRVAAASLKIA
jgi:hypothetical protein